MRHPHSRHAFTVLELLLGAAIIVILIASALVYFGNSPITTLVTGKFTLAPASVRQAPNSGTFTYTISRKIGTGPWTGIDSRPTKFEVFPASGVTILTLSNANTSITVNGPRGTLMTDALGQVTAVIQVDYNGSDARIEATDTTTGLADDVRFICVQ